MRKRRASRGSEASARRARRNVVLTAAIAVAGAAIAGGVLTLIFCWQLVPETKGRRLEDVQAEFEARVKP